MKVFRSVFHTWKRNVQWWAGGKRAGPVQHSCKAAATQRESRTLSLQESGDERRSDIYTWPLRVHTDQLQEARKHLPSKVRASVYRHVLEPTPAAPGTEHPAPIRPSVQKGCWSPAVSGDSSYSVPCGSQQRLACKCRGSTLFSDGW